MPTGAAALSQAHDTMNDVSRWGSQAPIVGRTDEVSTLIDTLTASLEGRASAVLLAGDAGVGKTRVLDEVSRLAREDGFTVLTGHCVDIGEVGLPYLPFSEILASLAQDPELAEVLQRHPEATRVLRTDTTTAPERVTSSRLELFGAIVDLFGDLADQHPLLILIEDLHWADQSTRELLHFLLSRMRTDRTTIIASYRTDDLHRRHPLRPLLAELVRVPGVVRRQLEPLPDGDVAALLRTQNDEPLSEPTMRGIISRAEGNAFYAEELLAATIAGGSGGAVPDGLADVLLTRLEQLSPIAQRVVRLASVAGRRVDHELLGTAADLPPDELDAALREAIGRHLLVSEDGSTYSFRHALLREAVYSDLLPGERSRIHATFARLLSAPGYGVEYAAARAHHFRASHDLPGALRASIEAADQAATVGAPAEEQRHLENVLEMWAAVPDAQQIAGHSDAVIMLRASTAAVQAGHPARAVALTRGAVDRVSPQADAELAARVRYTLAKNLMGIDDDDAAYKESSAALELIPADPPSLTWVWAATTHVLTSFYIGDAVGAREIGEQALAVAAALGADDAVADLLITMAGLTTPGRSTEIGRAQLIRANELAARSGNVSIELRAIFNLAIGAYEGGDLPEALRWARAGARTAGSVGLGLSTYGVELRFIETLATFAMGDWDTCLTIVANLTPSGHPSVGHIASVALGVPTARGQSDVRSRITDFGGRQAHPVVIVNEAGNAIDEAMWQQNAESAVHWFDRATAATRERFHEIGLPHLRLCALTLAAVADQVARSRLAGDAVAVTRWSRQADRIEELVRQAEMDSDYAGLEDNSPAPGPEAQAWLARCEAELARVRDADDLVERWEQTVETFGYGHVYETARSQWRLAEVLLAAGRRDEAKQTADSAHAVAVQLEAAPLRDALEALVRRGRLGSDPGRGSAAVVTLTPREQDVLALVVRGRSNRQIGAELFISDKTASVHVSNILSKLGAASRTEAAAIAHRDGLV